MEMLGLKPTTASGAGWIEKEDGQDNDFICQLKSTTNRSYRIQLDDLETLEYNAIVSHKVPVFAIQFLDNVNDIDAGVYLMFRASDLSLDHFRCVQGSQPYNHMAKYGSSQQMMSDVPEESSQKQPKPPITSSRKAKQKWKKEQEQKWKMYKKK